MDYIYGFLEMFSSKNEANKFKKPEGYKNVNSSQLLKRNK